MCHTQAYLNFLKKKAYMVKDFWVGPKDERNTEDQTWGGQGPGQAHGGRPGRMLSARLSPTVGSFSHVWSSVQRPRPALAFCPASSRTEQESLSNASWRRETRVVTFCCRRKGGRGWEGKNTGMGNAGLEL
jgi:hypothetical protein